MYKKDMLIKIIFISIVLILSMPLYAAEKEKDLHKDEALKIINNIRKTFDIDLISIDSSLEEAANNHSQYMYRNDSLTSIEEKDKKSYSGRFPWDRAAYFNYKNTSIAEFIDKESIDYEKGIIQFINNPYSRISLLDPLYQHIGFGISNNYYTYMIGGKQSSENYAYQVIYPYNNQENVPIEWINKFSLDPYKENIKAEWNIYSLPITYTYYSNQKLKSIQVNLEDTILTNIKSGKNVEIQIETPSTDKYLNNTVMVLPLEKLDSDTIYKFQLEVDLIFENNEDSETEKETIFFRTEKLEGEMSTFKKSDDSLTRGKFIDMMIEGLEIEKKPVPYTFFSDIPAHHPYAEAIYTAYQKQWVFGYGNYTFGSENLLTREQMIITLVRVYNQMINNQVRNDLSKIELPYEDYTDISSWAFEDIKEAYDIGLLDLFGNNEFKAKALVKEEEVEKVIYQLKEILNKNN